MEEPIKHFIDVLVPITSCTLRCPYCYITHHRLFDNKLPTFKYDVATWKQAFAKERWGGICLVNFCAAGETLLAPEMVDYIRVTLEQGHYVMVVTNATVDKAFERMLAEYSPELFKHLFFKFSYHYLQLTARKLTDRFFGNIRKMRDAGASFTLEVTPHDELIPYIDELKSLAIKEVGAIPHVTVARNEHFMDELPILTNLPREEYKRVWEQFDSKLFDFKLSIFNEPRKEFCNAGLWLHYLDMMSGSLFGCYNQPFRQNILADPCAPLELHAIGHWCRMPHCFNGHTWLGFGAVAGYKTPTYAEMRNRKCEDGTEWLQPEMKHVFETRLWQTNKPLNTCQKLRADAFTFGLLLRNKFSSLFGKQ